jgi:Spy/CpxP family protein refolding chaperone
MKAKPVILVIVTLGIGFFLGMLTSAQLRSHRLKPVRVFFSEEKFREGMYNAIQPTDEQKVKIDEILDKYSKMNSEATATFRKEFDTRMEKFRNEIDSNLTPEQLTRLKELDAQRQKMIKSRRDGHKRNFHGPEGKNWHDSITNAPGSNPPPAPAFGSSQGPEYQDLFHIE